MNNYLSIQTNVIPFGRQQEIYDFAQFVKFDCEAIGCAVSIYEEDKYTPYGEKLRHKMLVCNYSHGCQRVGAAVYNPGTPSASGCKTGPNIEYPGLCSANETYPNPKSPY